MKSNLRIEIRTKHPLASCATSWLALPMMLIFFPSLYSQTGSPIKGTVVTDDGQPIPGVSLNGKNWNIFYPVRQTDMITNEKGEFRLDHPSAVLHFWKEN